MRRKLIQQGGGGLTLYLPKKWIDGQGLRAGDEVSVDVAENGLRIIPAVFEKSQKKIELKFEITRESLVRTFILNAYRSGFDVISFQYPGKKEDIVKIVDAYLIGFEVVEKEGKLVIESVSEPSYESFEAILQRQFYMLGGILNDLKDNQVESSAMRIYRYDSFLKRCLAKGVFSSDTQAFLWQFLGDFLQVSRICLFCHRDMLKYKLGFGKEEEEFMKNILEMFGLLKDAYFKQDTSFIEHLHMKEESLRKKGVLILRKKDPVLLHYLMMLARQIYICGSPLEGVLQARKREA